LISCKYIIYNYSNQYFFEPLLSLFIQNPYQLIGTEIYLKFCNILFSFSWSKISKD